MLHFILIFKHGTHRLKNKVCMIKTALSILDIGHYTGQNNVHSRSGQDTTWKSLNPPNSKHPLEMTYHLNEIRVLKTTETYPQYLGKYLTLTITLNKKLNTVLPATKTKSWCGQLGYERDGDSLPHCVHCFWVFALPLSLSSFGSWSPMTGRGTLTSR